MTTFSLRQAWIALIGGVLALALVPAGIALDRRLAAELEERARSDLAMAPKIMADRNANRADALMMRAKDLASTSGLAEAVARGERGRAIRLAERALSAAKEKPVVVGGGGDTWTDVAPEADVVRATRSGEMPVRFGYRDGGLYRFSLAPLTLEEEWVGAVGLVTPVDQAVADRLAGLTQSEVVFLAPDGAAVAATGDVALPAVVVDSAGAWASRGGIHELTGPDGGRYWTTLAPLGEAGVVAFMRDVSEELALLPGLRRSAFISGLLALAVALLLGGFLASRMGRPVRALAEASQRLAEGDYEAPVPTSRVREVEQVSRAFQEMRSGLEEKIGQLTEANRELAERQERLQALQSQLIQRDRLAATGRLITELAHEIRNPVASVRNCLEIIHRRLESDSELREFSEAAIDELLRMHRLAEQMLDANRPMDPGADSCRPAEVAEQVIELARMAGNGDGVSLVVSGPRDVRVGIGPDALKQVLLNLLENAREALSGRPADEGGTVEIRMRSERDPKDEAVVIEVLDDGPGLEEEVKSRIFDPFVTTKEEVHGVGLGLFVAQGMVRRHGGSLRASNREERGARFTIRLPAVATPDSDEGGRGT